MRRSVWSRPLVQSHDWQDLIHEAADPLTVVEVQRDVADADVDEGFDLSRDVRC